MDMAAEGDAQTEIVSHKEGYLSFIAMMKWGAIISFVTGLIVIFLIAE